MPKFSEKLDIYENYTRGELCDLMNIEFNDEIERGVYKPRDYSTIIFFSTIHNNAGYINGKISDTEFLYSANSQYLDPEITQHQFTQKRTSVVCSDRPRNRFLLLRTMHISTSTRTAKIPTCTL